MDLRRERKHALPLDAINPYSLPDAVRERLLALAALSDVLLLGETHGTQEVPRLALGLLPYLAQIDYGALALEAPSDQRDQFVEWAAGGDAPPPFFGPSDFRDGRGNTQMLSLLRQASSAGWHLLCFDVAFMQPEETWFDRDKRMAGNLLEQWEGECPKKKVLGICGNYHSRLTPPNEQTDLWPSFAHSVQQARHDLAVNSVNIIFHGGEFFNGEVKTFNPGPEPFGEQAEVRPPNWLGHTLDLHLTHATAVTFLEAENPSHGFV